MTLAAVNPILAKVCCIQFVGQGMLALVAREGSSPQGEAGLPSPSTEGRLRDAAKPPYAAG
jgi:hypothetical protein